MISLSKWFILSGFILITLGFILYIFNDKFSCFGNLYGDFKYERDNIKIYLPIASMLIISIIATLVINLFSKIK